MRGGTSRGKKPRDAASRRKIEAAFHEVKHDTPRIVRHTAQKFGPARAAEQRKAIALDKARRAGAEIPPPKGG